jgi:hypothetical protein
MKIVQASAALKSAVCEYLCRAMAGHLLKSRADLRCDVSIICVLSRAGFGIDTMKALRHRAVANASRIAAITHKGKLQ